MSQGRRFRHVFARLLVPATLAVLLQGPAAEAAPGFMPHRAVYELALTRSRAGAVTDARGVLEFEWSDVCDGWAVRQRTRLAMSDAQGGAFADASTLNTWESKDGLSYRFFYHRRSSDGERQDRRGTARLTGPGEAGEVVYSDPQEQRESLPENTVFPSELTFRLLELADGVALPEWHTVFDAGGETGLYGTSVTLTKALSAEVQPRHGSPLLQGLPSWRVRLAFYPMEDRESATPEYEQDLRIFANGVVDELILHYGDFSLDATLKELEALDPPDCSHTKSR
jgi:hypothetical protein